MTVPLLVLGAASLVIGGVAGYPLEHGWINHFLDPVLGVSVHDTSHGLSPGILLAISVAAGLAGFAVALVMHRQGKLGAPSSNPLHSVLENKWYVDELYQAAIIRPIHRFSTALWNIFDTILVDGLVNGLGYFVKAVSWVVSRFQTGRAPTYALWMTLGAVVMIYLVTVP
jgi:NADH-quinone oxidoreductase subunit L